MMSPVIAEFKRVVRDGSLKIGFVPVTTRWIVERSIAWIEGSQEFDQKQLKDMVEIV